MVRASFFLIALAALAGSGAELFVATGLDSDFDTYRIYCRYFLCDEKTVANTAYHQQLLGNSGSVRQAVGLLQEVVLRDAASAERWIDLGEAFAAQGSGREARWCIARATDLGRFSADVLVPAGNFYLLSGDRREGIRYLSRALALTPVFDVEIFSHFGAQDIAVSELLKAGVPDDARVAQSYLRYAMARGEAASAREGWKWVYGHGFAEQPIASEYTNFLIGQKQFEEAAEVWASQTRYLLPGYRKTEYLFDSEFASEPIPGAYFDWRIAGCEGAEVTREEQAGAWALRVQFDGTANLDFRHISQRSVLPAGRYRFRARVKAENLTTDEGVFFRIADGEAAGRLSVDTTPVVGTSDWRVVEATVVVGPGTRVVEVSVNRRPSLRFDNKIKGTIWIERASLAPL